MLRPGIVGMRGSMVIRLRQRMAHEHPSSSIKSPPPPSPRALQPQACAKDGNVVDARKMLEDMWTSPDLEGGIPGLRPTTWGYNCAMEACARSGNWEAASDIMRKMRDHGGSSGFSEGRLGERGGGGGWSIGAGGEVLSCSALSSNETFEPPKNFADRSRFE